MTASVIHRHTLAKSYSPHLVVWSWNIQTVFTKLHYRCHCKRCPGRIGAASEGNKMATFPISCKLVAYTRLSFPFFQRIFHVASVPMETPWHQLTFPWNSDASLAASAPTKGLLIYRVNCTRKQEKSCNAITLSRLKHRKLCLVSCLLQTFFYLRTRIESVYIRTKFLTRVFDSKILEEQMGGKSIWQSVFKQVSFSLLS